MKKTVLLWKNTKVLWEKLWYFTENYGTLINYEKIYDTMEKNYGTIVNNC